MNDNNPQRPNIPAGPPLVGLILVVLIAWSLFTSSMTFAYLCVILLVVLSLGTLAITSNE